MAKPDAAERISDWLASQPGPMWSPMFGNTKAKLASRIRRELRKALMVGRKVEASVQRGHIDYAQELAARYGVKL